MKFRIRDAIGGLSICVIFVGFNLLGMYLGVH